MENWSSGLYPRPRQPLVGSNLYSTLSQENSHFNQVSAVVFNSTHEGCPASANPTYTYYVKIINTKRKSDFIVRMWHSAKHAFNSPDEIKSGLINAFPSEVPSTSTFQVGYLEPPSNTKRWLVEKRDLVAMYEHFEPGSKINLWCDAKPTCEETSTE